MVVVVVVVVVVVAVVIVVAEDLWLWIFFELSELASVLRAVWLDLAIYWALGNFLKPLATINLPHS